MATRLDRKFKPPARDDVKQWEKVRLLVEHGFRFQSVCDGQGIVVSCPASLAEVGAFVERFRNQAAFAEDPKGALPEV